MAGAKLAQALDSVVQEHKGHLTAITGQLGQKNVAIDVQVVTEARRALERVFRSAARPDSSRGKLRSDIIKAITSEAQDPDTDIGDWPEGQVPFGIAAAIRPGGVVPIIAEGGVGSEKARLAYLHKWLDLGGRRGNYLSYETHKEQADRGLQRELEAGYFDWDASQENLESVVGGRLHLARIAALVKETGGTLKTRLIHDLRRNGVNGQVRVQERLVLPRLRDVVGDALDLLEGVPPARRRALCSRLCRRLQGPACAGRAQVLGR